MFKRFGSYGLKQLDTFTPARIAGVKKHAALNTPVGEIDVSWLESAAAFHDVSPDPYNYSFSINRIVVADIPNRNSDAFPKAEIHRWNANTGTQVWKTFEGKPLYFEHNQVPKDARGMIFKSFITVEGPYHIITNVAGACRRKDPDLARAILGNTRPFFSMGCVADHIRCSVCKKKFSEPKDFCKHVSENLGTVINGVLVYEELLDVTFIEQSSVADPAALIAGKGNLDLQNGAAKKK